VNVQTDPLSNAWYDTVSTQEISSKCVGQYGNVNATDGHNIVLNNHKYVIQQKWSNAIIACTLIPPPTSSVTITLSASGLSAVISPANSFPVTYAIGNQEFVLNDIGNVVTVHADPNTSVSVGPESSRSNNQAERWCLNSACLGQVIPLTGNGQTATLWYYDLLFQSVYEVTSDSTQPVTFATLRHTTAPFNSGPSNSPTAASIILNQFSQGHLGGPGNYS
jgi:hypothetical protein